MIEILIALSVLGVLLALGAGRFRTPSATLLANDVSAVMQRARFESVKQNVPVGVFWNQSAERFEVRLNPSADSVADACNASDVTFSKAVAEYRNVQVTSTELERSPLIWLPSGLTRRCTQGASRTVTTEISDGRVSRSVTVNSAGQVSVF